MTCAKNFELLVCAFPGGFSYTNKKVYEHGDYKKVAFLDYYGCLRFDVPVNYIPGDALLRIERDADEMRANFKNSWENKTELQRLCKLYDLCSVYAGLCVNREWTRSEKVDFLEYAVFGWLPHSEKIAEAIQKNNIIPTMKPVKYFKE